MADPLSIASGVVGVLSFGIQVGESLFKYYSSYKGQDKSVRKTTERLDGLIHTLGSLISTIETRSFRADESDTVKAINSSILGCEALIEELQEECEKFNKLSAFDFKGAIKVAGRRIAYPLRESTLTKLNEDIQAVLENLVLATNALQLQDNRQLLDAVADTRQLVEAVQALQLSSVVRDWLKAPDPIISYNTASARRHPGTGLWLIKGTDFEEWLHGKNSFIWLNGFAGCGKSVLCSTAIQHTFSLHGSQYNTGIAFYYFTFNDASKQDASGMLRALLQQLSCQARSGHSEMSNLHSNYPDGVPSEDILLSYLKHLTESLQEVYIFLDAIDEVPRGRQRQQVLRMLSTMRSWGHRGFHLLVTSRNEVDIRDAIGNGDYQEVVMESSEVDADINDFVADALQTDTQLLKWKSHHDLIQRTLTRKANGVFRWVECQLESVKRCPRSVKRLTQCLSTLPKDLDETYERMLCNIGSESADDARRILTALCFSARPVSIPELADIVAVDLSEPAYLDRDLRLTDADSLQAICPGLIVINHPRSSHTDVDDTKDDIDFSYKLTRYGDFRRDSRGYGSITSASDFDEGLTSHYDTYKHPLVRIAHFSVQEYLVSSQIGIGKAAYFALDAADCHDKLTQICLAYLLGPEMSQETITATQTDDLPLIDYAARYWYHHYRHIVNPMHAAHAYVRRLFMHSSNSYCNWVRIHAPDRTRVKHHLRLRADKIPPPLYYAAWLGLVDMTEDLLLTEKNINRDMGWGGTVLTVAAAKGHEKLVQSLLQKGANVNEPGGFRGSPLVAAAYEGHEHTVRLLLNAGADATFDGTSRRFWGCGPSVVAAARQPNVEVLRMLLENGARIDAPGTSGSALAVASFFGHMDNVKFLLDHGADVNFLGCLEVRGSLNEEERKGASPLVEAVRGNWAKEELLYFLLDHGADVNVPCFMGPALPAAISAGRSLEFVRTLVEKGADVNAQSDSYGSALQISSWRGDLPVVQLLLENGADVNARQEGFHTPLQGAARRGYDQVVKILLEKGANVDDRGTLGATALQMASQQGYEEIVRMLVDRGADVNASANDEFDTPLQGALNGGHDQIAQLLRERGALQRE